MTTTTIDVCNLGQVHDDKIFLSLQISKFHFDFYGFRKVLDINGTQGTWVHHCTTQWPSKAIISLIYLGYVLAQYYLRIMVVSTPA